MIAYSGLIASAQTQTTSDIPQVHSICEVLKDLKGFDRKMVAIRGTLLSGPHASFLKGNCPSHLTAKGFTWPDLIWLTFPPGPDGHSRIVDTAAHEKVRKAINAFHLGQLDQVILTYVGILDAKDTIANVSVTRTGQAVGIGFGPDAAAPAQLLVYTVAEPLVVRHKESNKKQ